MTLPFNEDHAFQVVLHDNTAKDGPFVMVLLNEQPKPTRADPVLLSWRNNVYSAYGGRLDDPVSVWLREAYAGKGGLGLTGFVDYIHSKVILVDPLSADPIVISGSANFSVPSLQENDENSLIVRGDTRVADIYFTEFNRLFEHYQFRDVMSTVHHPRPTTVRQVSANASDVDDPGSDAGLVEDQSWAWRFLGFRVRGKRLTTYRSMYLPGSTLEREEIRANV